MQADKWLVNAGYYLIACWPTACQPPPSAL